MIQVIHVAVAVISDSDGRVLITLRPNHVHQGGLWEFPGGKVEPDETVFQAIKREIDEEVGLIVHKAQPLIKINHRYPDKHVFLDVWTVTHYEGKVYPYEDQEWQWVPKQDLYKFNFPKANRSIIRAANLMDNYLITPEPGEDKSAFMRQFEEVLGGDIKFIQFRAKSLGAEDYRAMAADLLTMCVDHGVTLMLNAEPSILDTVNATGIHLTSNRLMSMSSRPIDDGYWLAASCHNAREIEQAQNINVDFIVLGPVLATPSHPDVSPMGWQSFEALVSNTNLPVFGLGGLDKTHINKVRQAGGQGIAAVRGLWP